MKKDLAGSRYSLGKEKGGKKGKGGKKSAFYIIFYSVI